MAFGLFQQGDAEAVGIKALVAAGDKERGQGRISVTKVVCDDFSQERKLAGVMQKPVVLGQGIYQVGEFKSQS